MNEDTKMDQTTRKPKMGMIVIVTVDDERYPAIITKIKEVSTKTGELIETFDIEALTFGLNRFSGQIVEDISYQFDPTGKKNRSWNWPEF